MRIALFCPRGQRDSGESDSPEPPPEDRVRAALEGCKGLGDVEVIPVDGGSPLPVENVGADVLLLVLSAVPEVPPRWLRKLPEPVPTLVAAAEPSAAALLLRRRRVEEVVAVDRLEEELASAIRKTCGADVLLRTAAVVRKLDDLTPSLRRWLRRLLLTVPPYYTVKDSTRRPATVRKAWERKIGASSPKVVVRWILLVRAASLRGGRSWRKAAARVNVSPAVLDRAARAVLRCRLEELPPDGGRTIREQFERYLSRTIL